MKGCEKRSRAKTGLADLASHEDIGHTWFTRPIVNNNDDEGLFMASKVVIICSIKHDVHITS